MIGESPLYAAIDLGSNSFHMLVVRNVGGSVRAVSRVKRKIRLASGLDDQGYLNEEAMERGLDCLKMFAEQLANIPDKNIRIHPEVLPSYQLHLNNDLNVTYL